MTEKELNKVLPANEVLDRINTDKPAIYDIAKVSVVGAWVWIETNKKPDTETRLYLKELGFFWNRRREIWQHNCGVKSKKHPGDPRNKYGESIIDPDDLKRKAS